MFLSVCGLFSSLRFIVLIVLSYDRARLTHRHRLSVTSRYYVISNTHRSRDFHLISLIATFIP